MKQRALLAAVVALLVSPHALAGGEGWLSDYKAALAQAKKEKKDLLLDFTGSDWCGWCIKLNKEVFSQKEFKDTSPKNFVLVELDFPRAPGKITPETRAQNEKLQKEFGVQGFPTIWLADSEGRPYARTGYQQGGASNYVKHLETLRKTRVNRDVHFVKAEKAKGVERAKHLAAGLDALGDSSIVYHAKYGSVIDEIIKLDADGKAGLKKQYEAGRRDLEYGKKVDALERQFGMALQATGGNAEKMKETVAGFLPKLDALAKEIGSDKGSSIQKIFFLKANALYMQDQQANLKKVVETIKKAVDADPKSQIGQQLAGAYAQLSAQLAAQKKPGDKPEAEKKPEADKKPEAKK